MFDSRGGSQSVRDAGPRHVLTVVDTSVRERINVALGLVARPVHLDSLSAAIAATSGRPVGAVLIEPTTIAAAALPALPQLARACASSPLIAVVGGWSPDLPERLLAFGRFGVRDAVDIARREGLDRLRVLLTLPEWSISRRIAETVLPGLEHATEEMRYFVNALIRLAPSRSSTKQVALELGVLSTSLCSRFFRAQLPTPKSYLAMTRLLYAAAMFEVASVSASDVSRRLSYSSPQSFGRHIRGQLDVSASEFRQEYPYKKMADYFIMELLFRHRTTLRWFEPLGGRVRGGQNC